MTAGVATGNLALALNSYIFRINTDATTGLATSVSYYDAAGNVHVQPGKVIYRAGDHELMPGIFVGQVHPPKAGGNPDDLFTVEKIVPGEQAAGTVADTGCKMMMPAT